MSLSDIVRALGGDLYGPHRALIPGPGHGPMDRSVSLMVDRQGRLVVSCWGRSSWQEVLDDLRARGFVDDQKRLAGSGSGAGYHGHAAEQDLSAAEKVRFASQIWGVGQSAVGTLSARHAMARGIRRVLPGAEVMRHTSAAPLRAYDSADHRTHAALLVAVRTADDELTAVEVTFLDRSGERARRQRLSRKTVGVLPPGSAVRIDPPAAEMLVGEGVFTTLSASERFELPAWALLSTSRLIAWRPPPQVRRVLVAGDNGAAGQRAARVLVRRLRDAGLAARAVFPEQSFGDFNDQARGLLR